MEAAAGGTRATLNVREAAAVLGLGKSATYEAIARGDLPSLRIGRRILVPRRALERLLGEEADHPSDLERVEAERVGA